MLSITRPKYATIIAVAIAVDFCTKGIFTETFWCFLPVFAARRTRELAVCRFVMHIGNFLPYVDIPLTDSCDDVTACSGAFCVYVFTFMFLSCFSNR